MIQRLIGLTLLSTTSLVGMAGVAHASPLYPCGDEPPGCTRVASPHTPGAVVTAYFSALQTGTATGNFSALAALFASRATVTRHDGTGASQTARGPVQIERLYQQA